MSQSASPYAQKPWLKLYPPGLPKTIAPDTLDALSLFRAAVARAPDAPALLYFDGALSYRQLESLSDALAAVLIERGFAPGDRLALYLQNMPHFHLAVLAAWKAGGVIVPINPMNRFREVSLILADSRPSAFVGLDTLYDEVWAEALADASPDARPKIVFTASAHDFQSRDDFRALPPRAGDAARPENILAAANAALGRAPAQDHRPTAQDLAFLVYTSGTTGLPKAAMNTQANIAFNAQAMKQWYGLQDGDRVLGVAPLFHVTGLISNVILPWTIAGAAALIYRFEPAVALDALLEHRPAFMVNAITAYIALMNHKAATPSHFDSLRVVLSGGAPIPPSVVEEFFARTGRTIMNGYGMTETNAAAIATPLGRESPVDSVSGALAIGAPEFNLDVWIAEDNGAPAPVGVAGEIVISGPNIFAGYWGKPEETAQNLKSDGFRTGDIGFMDENGWFYLVDRKKDMIIASGFKIWPREIEDVLYTHPAVREAAVIGVKDAYRGETVKAFVSLKEGAELAPAELLDWCRPRMAAYKRPSEIAVVDELPKTQTGKILRRSLK